MISSFSNDFDFDSDDFFKKHSHQIELEGPPVMEIVVSLVVLLGLAVLLALCCKCCCSNKYKGRVLQPPPESALPAAAYPQQQYNTVTIPTGVVSGVAPGHVNVSAYPTNAAYPTTAPYPTAAYPTAYPPGGYAGGAPYPAVAAFPPNMPQPSANMPQPSANMPQPAPSAPHEQAFIGVAPPGWHPQALPPTYDQVMSSDVKHPPYNPYAPH